MVSSMEVAFYASSVLGILLGAVSAWLGFAHVCCCHPNYKAWVYGYNHIFADYIGVHRQGTKTKQCIRLSVGMAHASCGVGLIVTLSWSCSGRLPHEYYNAFNVVIACAVIIMMLLQAMIFRVRLSVKGGCDRTGVVLFLTAAALLGLRFHAIPLWTIDKDYQKYVEFTFFGSFLFFCILNCCHHIKGSQKQAMVQAYEQFDDMREVAGYNCQPE